MTTQFNLTPALAKDLAAYIREHWAPQWVNYTRPGWPYDTPDVGKFKP